MLCRLSLSLEHVATEGANLTGFSNALVRHASRTEGVNIKLVELFEENSIS
jgi:hypothetical protein